MAGLRVKFVFDSDVVQDMLERVFSVVVFSAKSSLSCVVIRIELCSLLQVYHGPFPTEVA